MEIVRRDHSELPQGVTTCTNVPGMFYYGPVSTKIEVLSWPNTGAGGAPAIAGASFWLLCLQATVKFSRSGDRGSSLSAS